MIPVETAVRAAIASLPSFLGGRTPDSIRVEEVIPPEGAEGVWHVTLSYLEPGVASPQPMLSYKVVERFTPPAPERVMRVIEVDAGSGSPRSMKLRQAG